MLLLWPGFFFYPPWPFLFQVNHKILFFFKFLLTYLKFGFILDQPSFFQVFYSYRWKSDNYSKTTDRKVERIGTKFKIISWHVLPIQYSMKVNGICSRSLKYQAFCQSTVSLLYYLLKWRVQQYILIMVSPNVRIRYLK